MHAFLCINYDNVRERPVQLWAKSDNNFYLLSNDLGVVLVEQRVASSSFLLKKNTFQSLKK